MDCGEAAVAALLERERARVDDPGDLPERDRSRDPVITPVAGAPPTFSFQGEPEALAFWAAIPGADSPENSHQARLRAPARAHREPRRAHAPALAADWMSCVQGVARRTGSRSA